MSTILSLIVVGFLIALFADIISEKEKTKAIISLGVVAFEFALIITLLAIPWLQPVPKDKTVVKEYQVTSVIMKQEKGVVNSKTYLVQLENHQPVTFGDTNSQDTQLFIISGKPKALKKIKSTVKIKKVRTYSYDEWVPFKIHSKVETRYIARITKTDMP
ncbi:hypothetical protein [Lactiplantibacillus plantarum]|uniref:hypothetical protein n=1 Tax=Lactiplantibacillus plantarum TaxID=1590 RepID=UPI0021A64796|nr:hypothetical protein [Lactiplantibacillus plantarum]MCT3206481.1 hypothetical protein [Lactiplantibacillus plantarum]MCT3220197.1 hypothetical protein [Lactiplantibacillus plantarum]MCT3281527.1 hypothetical protein [Lactiplantibacillus plantarum]